MYLALAIVVVALFGAILGTALNFMGVFMAIPLAFIVIGFAVTREQMSRQRRVQQLHRFRKAARARETEFTPADKRTVV
jgi:uncharacterized membrane protein YdjX (TVP38/TMEM64 family)